MSSHEFEPTLAGTQRTEVIQHSGTPVGIANFSQEELRAYDESTNWAEEKQLWGDQSSVQDTTQENGDQ